MSLSTWFRDYIYIPLGGNRVSKSKWLRNILIVWLLTGLWHGASWNFVIWGLYYGVLLILEKFVFSPIIKKLPAVVTRIYTLLAVIIGWVIFEISSPADEISFIGAMFGASGEIFNTFTLNMIHNYAIIIFVAIVISTGFSLKLWKKITCGKRTDGLCILGEAIGFIACIAYLADASYNPFLYFNF